MDVLRIIFDMSDLDEKQRLSGVCRYFRNSINFGDLAKKQTVRSVVKYGSRRLSQYVANRFGVDNEDWRVAIHRAFLAGFDDLGIWMIPKARIDVQWLVNHAARFGIIAEYDYAMTLPGSDVIMTYWAGLHSNIPARTSVWSEAFVAGYRGAGHMDDINSILGAIYGGHPANYDTGYAVFTCRIREAICEAGRFDMVTSFDRLVYGDSYTNAFVSGHYFGGNRKTTKAAILAVCRMKPSFTNLPTPRLKCEVFANRMKSKWMLEYLAKCDKILDIERKTTKCPAILTNGKICGRDVCNRHMEMIRIYIWVAKVGGTIMSVSEEFDSELLDDHYIVLAAIPPKIDSYIAVTTAPVAKVVLVSTAKRSETALRHASRLIQGPGALIHMCSARCTNISYLT